MEEEFEVVKSKGRRCTLEAIQEEVKPECMILSEAEMAKQSNRMNWRKGTNNSVADLFRIQHGRPEFPTIFQNYKPAAVKKDTPFTAMKLKNGSKTLKPEINAVSENPMLELGALQIRVAEPVDEPDPPYGEKTP